MDSRKACYVLALDVGTTSVRAHVYDRQAQCIASDSKMVRRTRIRAVKTLWLLRIANRPTDVLKFDHFPQV